MYSHPSRYSRRICTILQELTGWLSNPGDKPSDAAMAEAVLMTDTCVGRVESEWRVGGGLRVEG